MSEFLTLRDPVLEAALAKANEFVTAIESKAEPFWLTLAGTSGTGKTMLSKLIRKALPHTMREHASLLDGVAWWDWTDLLDRFRNREYWIAEDIKDANILFLDDIGSCRETEFALDVLYRTLNPRLCKWTFITSNLSLPQIGERLDTRVASRLIRGRNVVVPMETVDFALRST